ncbi:hypothetical protein ACEQ8H_006458 [Pleosporales sp. CAS-2024a]
MPTEQENVQYLYLVLTHGGAPTIDYDAVSDAMQLSRGAVSKRWSRLKKAMEQGEAPGPSVYRFLWLCVKHSNRDKSLNWNEIAAHCNTTAGAAAKRYSRMKQAFENGDAPPGLDTSGGAGAGDGASPRDVPKTPRKNNKALTPAGDTTPTPTPASKRKRASAAKKAEHDGNDDVDAAPAQTPSKKAKATPKKKTAVKNEEVDNNGQEDMEMRTPSNKSKAKATPKKKVAVDVKGLSTPTKTHDNMSTPSSSEAMTLIASSMDGATEADADADADVDEPDIYIDAKEWVHHLVGGSTGSHGSTAGSDQHDM